MAIERDAAQQALFAGASSVNATLPSFCAWLTAGCAAAFVLVLVNIETILKFVASSFIRWGFILFLASLVLAVLGRYLSSVISTSLIANQRGRDHCQNYSDV